MARLARHQASTDDEDDSSSRMETSQSATRTQEASSSPAESFSSDKENRTRPSTMNGKRRSDEMRPSSSAAPTAESSASNKRRKLADRNNKNLPSQIAHQRRLEEVNDTEFYDPDQDEEERRAVRKGLRDLSKDLNTYKSDYLQSGSRGILETLTKQNELFKSVKQTSDATIDSRLLVEAADLSYKKTVQISLGDTSAGIDVDEFVSKCITFMRQGPNMDDQEADIQHQSRRRRTQIDDIDEENDGNSLNWDWLGRQACFPHNVRPPVPGFLLGPLSVQKKVRQQTQRRAREAPRNPAEAIRPEKIEAKDLDKETKSLPVICRGIYDILVNVQVEGQRNAEAEVHDDMDDDEIQDTLAKNNVTDSGGVPLFRFCANPKSFGQSIENLFYVSFLVKEGKVGLELDSRQNPNLIVTNAGEQEKEDHPKQKPKSSQRHQVIFKLDFPTWKTLLDVYQIEESLIPHRVEEPLETEGSGWYP